MSTSPNTALTNPEHFTADSEAARQNRATLEEHLRAEIAGELEATLATMAPEPFLLTGSGLQAHGFDQVKNVYETRFKEVPDQEFVVLRSLVTESSGVIEGFVTATPKGKFFGQQGHGKPIRVPATVWISFQDGKLAGERGYLDRLELQQQLLEGAPSLLR